MSNIQIKTCYKFLYKQNYTTKHCSSEIRRVAYSQSHAFWIGLSDVSSEGTWVFTNDQPVNNLMFYWNNGEPNNAAGNEDCAFVEHNGNIFDIGCYRSDYVHRALCQIPNGLC